MVIFFLDKLPHIMLYFQICSISFFGNVFIPCFSIYACRGGLLPFSSFPPPAVTSTPDWGRKALRFNIWHTRLTVFHPFLDSKRPLLSSNSLKMSTNNPGTPNLNTTKQTCTDTGVYKGKVTMKIFHSAGLSWACY